ncbi:pyrroline-5-carboxylate reductase 3 isoform X2 [Pogona vitticeps]
MEKRPAERAWDSGGGRQAGRQASMERLRELRVGFVGAGRMASAVAQALLLAGKTGPALAHWPGGPSKQDHPESCQGWSFQKSLRSQLAQTGRRSSGSAAGVDHPPGHPRLSLPPNQAGSPKETDQENISPPGNPGVASPSRIRSPYPRRDYWRTEGEVPPVNIFASAPSNRNLEKFQNLDCKTTHSNLEVMENSTFVFLATKPHVLPAVLQEIAPAVHSHHVVISMAAGVTLQTLEEMLPAGTKVLRIMPNLPCTVQSGAIILARGSFAGEQEAALLKKLLSPCGLCEEGPESYIDIHTGLSGSGVAYGAAKMILETGEHPAVLRSAVCTPGGTTIHALHELEKGGLRATVMNAVEAATCRAQALGKR